MIIEKHYTHSVCVDTLGIYYVGEQDHKFYDGKAKLIGCMTYGYPVGVRSSL